jgi:hypothetical protein
MITHQISVLAKKLECAEELHKVRNTLDYEADDADRLEAFLSVLLSAVTLAPQATSPSEIAAQERIRSEIAQVKYAIAIHVIFISRFLNRCASIVRDGDEGTVKIDGTTFYRYSIVKERARMQQYLGFFERWRTEMRGRGGTYKDYSKTFLANETYRNLKVTIHGFFEYASLILDTALTVRFIPYLHANQSTIENVFSQIRGMHRANALSFQKALLAQQWRVNLPALVNNKMYDPRDIGDTDVKIGRLENVLWHQG